MTGNPSPQEHKTLDPYGGYTPDFRHPGIWLSTQMSPVAFLWALSDFYLVFIMFVRVNYNGMLA